MIDIPDDSELAESKRLFDLIVVAIRRAVAEEIRIEVFDETAPPDVFIRTGTHGADAWMTARANFDDWCARQEASP